MKALIYPCLFVIITHWGYTQTPAKSIFEQTNGKFNKAITVTMDGQSIELKPISCGLQHIEKKNRKTGEVSKYDRLVLMLIDQNDGSYQVHINFRDSPTATGTLAAGEEKRETPIYSSLDNYDSDNYIFPRPHFSMTYFIKNTDKKLRFFDAVYAEKPSNGECKITRIDLDSHRISLSINTLLHSQSKKTIDFKGLIINDLPFAEMTADDMGMPKKVIYQEKF